MSYDVHLHDICPRPPYVSLCKRYLSPGTVLNFTSFRITGHDVFVLGTVYFTGKTVHCVIYLIESSIFVVTHTISCIS